MKNKGAKIVAMTMVATILLSGIAFGATETTKDSEAGYTVDRNELTDKMTTPLEDQVKDAANELYKDGYSAAISELSNTKNNTRIIPHKISQSIINPLNGKIELVEQSEDSFIQYDAKKGILREVVTSETTRTYGEQKTMKGTSEAQIYINEVAMGIGSQPPYILNIELSVSNSFTGGYSVGATKMGVIEKGVLNTGAYEIKYTYWNDSIEIECPELFPYGKIIKKAYFSDRAILGTYVLHYISEEVFLEDEELNTFSAYRELSEKKSKNGYIEYSNFIGPDFYGNGLEITKNISSGIWDQLQKDVQKEQKQTIGKSNLTDNGEISIVVDTPGVYTPKN